QGDPGAHQRRGDLGGTCEGAALAPPRRDAAFGCQADRSRRSLRPTRRGLGSPDADGAVAIPSARGEAGDVGRFGGTTSATARNPRPHSRREAARIHSDRVLVAEGLRAAVRSAHVRRRAGALAPTACRPWEQMRPWAQPGSKVLPTTWSPGPWVAA